MQSTATRDISQTKTERKSSVPESPNVLQNDESISYEEMLGWNTKAAEVLRRCDLAFADLEHESEVDLRVYDETAAIMTTYEEIADQAEILVDEIGDRRLRNVSALPSRDVDTFEDLYSRLMMCYGRAKVLARRQNAQPTLRVLRPGW